MKNELQQNGVHLANLGANLRNTETIGELSRNVKSYGSRFANSKITQHIQQLAVQSSDVRSTKPPFLIPMLRKNRSHQLKKVLKKALERSKQSTKNVVIIYDERSLSSEEIKKALLECGEEEDNILLHPDKSKNESPTRLINYLKQPKGIYVVPFDKFVGMEANSVIYIISQRNDDKYDDIKSIRCNISRAVAQLSIIMEMREGTFFNSASTKILFHSAEVDPTFVECRKTIKFNAFKCNSTHFTIPSSSSSITSSLPQLEQQQDQEPSSKILNFFKKEKYVCEACAHVCHNNHLQRSYAKLGGGAFKTFFEGLRSVCGDMARFVKCSIVGETKCCCNELTECQLLKDGSFFNVVCCKNLFWRIMYFSSLVVLPASYLIWINMIWPDIFNIVFDILPIMYFIFLLYALLFK